MTTKKAKYQVRTYGEMLKDSTDKFNTKKEALVFMKSQYDFMVEMEAQTFSLQKFYYFEDGDYDLDEVKTKYTIHNF